MLCRFSQLLLCVGRSDQIRVSLLRRLLSLILLATEEQYNLSATWGTSQVPQVVSGLGRVEKSDVTRPVYILLRRLPTSLAQAP